MKPTTSIGILAAAVAVFGADAAVGATDSAAVAKGRAVAERNCATCHAVADGESPLRDAPPFATIRFRYGAGGLAELLQKGMIKDYPRPLEEGTQLLHPRMPAFPLDEDEITALAEYLRTFETAPGKR
jgi:mono/diheme cytochrome c family protein